MCIDITIINITDSIVLLKYIEHCYSIKIIIKQY